MAFLLAFDIQFNPLNSLAQVTLIITAAMALWRIWNSFQNPMPYPPGPPARNLLAGNAADIPQHHPWLAYTQWGKVYGDITHIRLYGQHTIILNSFEAITELLEKRSNVHSSRPHLEIIQLMGWDFNVGLKPYGPEWRTHRRIFQQMFRPAALSSLRPIITKKTKDMLYYLLKTPNDFMNHYRTFSTAISMSSAYGYDIDPKEDQFVSLAESATERLLFHIVPGATIVNIFPILKNLPEWFPGAGILRYAKETKQLTEKLLDLPLNFVKKSMSEGTSTPCLASNFLARCTSDEEILTIKGVCATIYAAGADTAASALGTFFYAMATHPEIQKRAQHEIDDAVDGGRLVTLEDMDRIPYVTALCRELMRWRPVLPLCLPHSAIQDDVYKGYLIPKGAIIIPNIWAISHDERRFKNPEKLDPDRQLDDHGNLRKDYNAYVFGFGRRICPGRHMATEEHWLAIASILSTFNISLKKDATGNDIPIEMEYSSAAASHPGPFECAITPRSRAAELIIREAVGKSDD